VGIMKIYPISASNISIENLIRGSKEHIGYSPLTGVDRLHRNLSPHARYIAGIAGFHNRQDADRPLAALRDARSILTHLHFGFLIECDAELILNIRERTNLDVTCSEGGSDGERVAVMSGTLDKYRQSAIECCTLTSPFELIFLFDQLILFFEKVGLGDIWFDYRKITQRDNTFYLEHKP
jgi:hypothetical protein